MELLVFGVENYLAGSQHGYTAPQGCRSPSTSEQGNDLYVKATDAFEVWCYISFFFRCSLGFLLFLLFFGCARHALKAALVLCDIYYG